MIAPWQSVDYGDLLEVEVLVLELRRGQAGRRSPA